MRPHIEAYLRKLEVLGAAKNTLCWYRYPLSLFEKGCPKEIQAVTEEDLLAFIESLRQNNLAPRTVSNYLRAVKIFFRTQGIQFSLNVRYIEPEVDSYSRKEIKAMLGSASGRQRICIHFFLGTGVREGEAAHAEKEDIDFEKKVLRIRPKAQWGWKPKTWECRQVPLPDSLLEALKDFPSGLLFPNKDGNPDGHLLRMLKQVATRACVQDATLHRFRRSFATWHHDSGVSARTVQFWLGHKRLETTQRYLAASDLSSDTTRTQVNHTFGGL